MDAFDGAGEGQGDCVAASTSLGGGQEQGRAHPLAAGEERVAHRLVDRDGLGFLAGQKFVERAVDGVGARGEELLQIKVLILGGHKIQTENAGNEGKFEGKYSYCIKAGSG